MENKIVIQRKKDLKWCDLDYHDGSEVIFVKSFLTCLKFNSEILAENFLNKHNLNKNDFEIYRIKVYAEPLAWS